MKRYLRFFSVITFFVILGARPVFSLPRSFADSLLKEDYGTAGEILNEVENPAEQLFGRGVLAKEQTEYRRARRFFRRLIRNHPETTRATDAEFFLDWIKLQAPRTQAPPVQVQLQEANQITGTLTETVRVENERGEKIRELNPGTEWTVRTGRNGNVVLSIDSRTGKSSTAEEIRLRPASSSAHMIHDGTRYRGDFLLRRTPDETVILINQLPVEKYLYGVVRKEIAPNWPDEVVKAQAVAARSFVVARMRSADNGEGFDVQSTHFSQVYGGYDAEDPQIRQAVDATAGQVLTYKNRVVPAYYHANSGGHIETAQTVWESAKTPYIVPKKDTWSASAQHARWEEELTQSEIVKNIRKNDLPNPTRPLGLEREELMSSGRARTVSYRSPGSGRTEVNANKFRIALGPRKIKSTFFESIDENSTRIKFRGRGWGHGIGLSQWGARAMAKNGFSHREILNFYYVEANLLGGYGLGAAHGENIINE